MSCKNCKFAPRTYEEYCIAQSNPREYCADAFTGKSSLCELYTDTKGDFDEDKKKFLELINMTDKNIKKDIDYIDSRVIEESCKGKSRLTEVKEERKDYEFSATKERQIAELAILNDTLALIYDYISEKK